MINKSQTFVDAITGNLRHFVPRVIIPSIYSELPYYTTYEDGSPQSDIGRPSQLCNNVIHQSYAWNTLERNRMKADGRWVVYNNNSLGEFGWIGDEMCDEFGEFQNEQWGLIKFMQVQNFTTFSIHFDYYAQEWATDFDIIFYKNDGTAIIKEFNILDHSSISWTMNEEIRDVYYAKFIVRKWSVGARRCKVIEFSEIDLFIFEDESITSLELIDQLSVLESTLITSELKISFVNVDGKFNLLTNGIIHSALSKKQRVLCSLLINNDETYFGNKYIHKRTVTNTSCDVICRDITEFATVPYLPLSHESISAYNLFVIMFGQLNIFDFIIDERLHDVDVNQYGNNLAMKTSLQLLANASGSYIRQGRQGEFIVEMIDDLYKRINVEYSYNTQLNKLTVEQLDTISSVIVSYYEYAEEVTEDNEPTIIIDNIKNEYFADTDVILEFGKIVINPTITITPTVDYEVFSNCLKFNVINDGIYTINVTGTVMNQISKSIDIRGLSYDSREFKKPEAITNPFIINAAQAKQLADNMIKYSKLKSKVTLMESGRPDIETGDNIMFQADEGLFHGVLITQNLKYDGSLRGHPVIMCDEEGEI